MRHLIRKAAEEAEFKTTIKAIIPNLNRNNGLSLFLKGHVLKES